MAKQTISFRVQPWHLRAIKEEIERGKPMTAFFEELLNQRFPVSSRTINSDGPFSR